jgi:uncharacterized protein DUF4397
MSVSMNLSPVERAMTPLRFFSLGGVLLLAIGCSKEKSFTEPGVPQAGITWMNVIPDTGELDMRVVDIVSSTGFFNANFRSAQPFPLGIEAGTRRIKVFMSSTDPNVSQTVLLDTTFAFTANQTYSFYATGMSRTAQTPGKRALIVNTTLPAVPAGKFAIRFLNLAPSSAGAVPTPTDTMVHYDAFFIKGNSALPTGAPTQADAGGAGYLNMTPYIMVDTAKYRLALTPIGTTNSTIAQVYLPTGVPGSAGVDPIAGSQISGSVITAVIVPRSAPTSAAPQTRPASKATEVLTLSTDTVTLQSGSVRLLTNRSGGKADSTLSKTGTGASTGAAAGDLVLIAGTTQPEYTGWQTVMAVADSLVCKPTDPGDTATKCAAANDTATTFFRFRYRIQGAPVSPATGTTAYRIGTTTADFTVPTVLFVVDKRP